MIRELAKIRSTFLGQEDHGIWTGMIELDFESGSSCSIGGYCLDTPIRDAQDKFLRREGIAKGMQWVIAVVEAAGVASWEKLPGTMIYALYESENRFPCIGIQGVQFGKEGKTFLWTDVYPKEG